MKHKFIKPLASSVLLCGTALAASNQAACLAMKNFSYPRTAVTSAAWHPAGQFQNRTMAGVTNFDLPAHCEIDGVTNAYIDSKGRKFGVEFQLRFPADWNGRFFFQGGGGLDGSVLPAYGTTVGGTPALARGFAVVSMDGGHEGLDASFASSQQARLDYAYQAVGKATAVAKAAIEHFYAKSPLYSYFFGCSNGGREAMIAAQRYPLEFDGIVAGDPGFRLAHAAVDEAWNNKNWAAIAPKDAQGHPDLSRALTDADQKLITDTVLAQCDKLDGLADGMINNQAACHFTPQTLLCAAGQTTGCLTQAKIDAVEAVMKGPHDSKGNALYSGFAYDAGLFTPGWNGWMLGIPGRMKSLNEMLGGGSLSLYFLTPAQPDRNIYDLDFDQAAQNIASTAAINDADSLMLASFTDRGGKLIIYQGTSDPVFSPLDIQNWYQRLSAATPNTQDFVRLFMIPGMNHCGGGPATDQFDALASIQSWVEQHRPPDRIIATGATLKGQSRPLCAWPKYARFQGGNPAAASSFQCVKPD